MKVFSKRHPEAWRDVVLSPGIRQRIWYLMEESDPYYDENSINNDWTLCWDGLPAILKKEHGWQDLRAYKSQTEWEALNSAKEFVLRGVPRFVLDGVELFYDLLNEYQKHSKRSIPVLYQSKLNTIFEDGNLPWRLVEGRILRMDSKWLEAEIHAKASELLKSRAYDGALAEFQQARSDLSSGDVKGAIHGANLAFESTVKSILSLGHEKPGKLFRKLIDSGLVPEYYEGFLKAFEEHILRAVPMARNFEKGVGHGQGAIVNDPPKSLAELTINLSGVLILFLLKRHIELNSQADNPDHHR